MADWAPGPGVLVEAPPLPLSLMWTALIPTSWRALQTSTAASIAKKTISKKAKRPSRSKAAGSLKPFTRASLQTTYIHLATAILEDETYIRYPCGARLALKGILHKLDLREQESPKSVPTCLGTDKVHLKETREGPPDFDSYDWVGEMHRFLTSIWRGLLSISLNLHSSTDSSVGLSSGEIGDVDEGVVESGQNVDNSEGVLVLKGSGLGWSEVGNLLFLDFDFLLGWLQKSQRECFYLPF